MNKLALASILLIPLLAGKGVHAEGDITGTPPRVHVGSVPNTITGGALRAVTSISHLGAISCPASDTRADGKTICSNTAGYAFTSEGADVTYALNLQAPTSHCAPIVYTVLVDNSTQVRYSNPLNGGQSQFVELGSGYAAGRHQVRIGAMAQIGQGCNTTGLRSWSVNVSTAIVPR